MAVLDYNENGMTLFIKGKRVKLSHEDLDRIEQNNYLENMSDNEFLRTVEVMGIVNELKTDPKPLK